MGHIPYTRHRFDLDAYRIVGTFEDGPRVVEVRWASEMLIPLWWRGLLTFDGPRWRLTDHGADFCAAMRFVLRLPARCSACGSPYHPASGHVLGASTCLCGGCARDWLRWLRGNLARKWSGSRFYDAAATSIRAPQEADPVFVENR